MFVIYKKNSKTKKLEIYGKIILLEDITKKTDKEN